MDHQNLQRFVEVQNPLYREVIAELAVGAKQGHWMWFIFPQLQGLGRSAMAVKYGISSVDEAQAYWAHPILGKRLEECVRLVLAVNGKTAFQILGTPDDLKFRSCMTLFAHAVPEEMVFKLALAKYFNGVDDPRTKQLLNKRTP